MSAGIVEIYALSCPDTGAVRYIGKANDSLKRLKSHIRDSRRRDTPVYRWFRKLALSQKMPAMKVVATAGPDEWESTERRLILEYRAAGAQLLNVAEGGDHPFCSIEQRATNGRATAKAIHSDPKRKRVWELKRGMSSSLKFLKENNQVEAYNRIIDKLQEAAYKAPHLFGEYALLQPIA